MRISIPSLCLVTALSFTASSTYAAPHDFDGDGISDISIVSIKSDGELRWRNFLVGSGSTEIAAESFGKAGNNLISGNWTSPALSQIGVVNQRQDKSIVWRLADGTSNETEGKVFGKGKNTILSGGDFNGNGYADAAIVRGAAFIIQPDFFAPSIQAAHRKAKRSKRAKVSATEVRTSLKRSGDLPFFASYDGAGDWAAVIRPLKNFPGQYRIIMRNPFTGQRRSVKMGSVAGSKPPLPVKQVTGGDLFAFSSSRNGQTTVVFKDMLGATVATHTVPGDGEVLVGEYSSSHAGQEVAVEDDGIFTLISPSTGPLGAIDPPNGIAVDHINITRFGSSGSDGGGNGGKEEYLNPRDGGWGFLWKPISESNGKLVILFPYQYTGKISSCVLVSASGSVIETGVFSSIGNGQTPSTGREHFRFSKPGSGYPANVVVRANLKDGGSINYVIDKPSSRID